MDLKSADTDDRLGFIRKVYMILLSQLIVTAIFITIGITSTSMAAWMTDSSNIWLYILVVIFACII